MTKDNTTQDQSYNKNSLFDKVNKKVLSIGLTALATIGGGFLYYLANSHNPKPTSTKEGTTININGMYLIINNGNYKVFSNESIKKDGKLEPGETYLIVNKEEKVLKKDIFDSTNDLKTLIRYGLNISEKNEILLSTPLQKTRGLYKGKEITNDTPILANTYLGFNSKDIDNVVPEAVINGQKTDVLLVNENGVYRDLNQNISNVQKLFEKNNNLFLYNPSSIEIKGKVVNSKDSSALVIKDGKSNYVWTISTSDINYLGKIMKAKISKDSTIGDYLTNKNLETLIYKENKEDNYNFVIKPYEENFTLDDLIKGKFVKVSEFTNNPKNLFDNKQKYGVELKNGEIEVYKLTPSY
ncbi:MAG: hypothetical protein ABGW69_03850 [Nanoarchaeota archaeon]